MIKNIEDLLERWYNSFILSYDDKDCSKILTFMNDLRLFCEKYQGGLIFSNKEIEILKSTNDHYLLLDVLKDYLNDKKYCNNYDVKMFNKLNETELIEFKFKLEKLVLKD